MPRKRKQEIAKPTIQIEYYNSIVTGLVSGIIGALIVENIPFISLAFVAVMLTVIGYIAIFVERAILIKVHEYKLKKQKSR